MTYIQLSYQVLLLCVELEKAREVERGKQKTFSALWGSGSEREQ